MLAKTVLTTLFLVSLLSQCSARVGVQQDKCGSLSSCSACLSKSYCSWCVIRSECTKHSCGNDRAIYPKEVMALMSGNEFCPRIVNTDHRLTVKSGSTQMIAVKITQIYMYMAFTEWKCKININDKEILVNAVLIADNVYCESIKLNNESDNPYTNGNVTVLWDKNKPFDGVQPFRLCRCDLEPNCVACKE